MGEIAILEPSIQSYTHIKVTLIHITVANSNNNDAVQPVGAGRCEWSRPELARYNYAEQLGKSKGKGMYTCSTQPSARVAIIKAATVQVAQR